MANEVMSVTDPLGNTIFLLEGTCVEDEKENPEIYDTATTVIQKPALMIKLDAGPELEHYYFRSIGWHSTMLVTAIFRNGRWESYKCVRNPTNEELSSLLKKGKQLL
jgi:hypothetical protein